MGESVRDRGERGDCGRANAETPPAHGLDIGGRVAFREAPQPTPDPARGATFEEQRSAGVAQHQERGLPARHGAPGPRRGNASLHTCAPRHAVRFDRTERARRTRTHAERRAEIHDGLGVDGHSIGRRMPLRKRPQGALDRTLSGPALDAVVTTEHPLDVAVEDRVAITVTEGEDRTGGRTADPGQSDERIELARHLAVVPVPHQGRGAMQIARPRVVTEPGPQSEHVVERSVRKVRKRRKPRHEPLVVPDDDADLRLLEHDLRHPHAVGRRLALPRQVLPAVTRGPADQTFGHRHEIVPPGVHAVRRPVLVADLRSRQSGRGGW